MTTYVDVDFEGTGEPAGWLSYAGAAGGIVDYDYTTRPLGGSQSLRMKDDTSEGTFAGKKFSDDTGLAAIYGRFALRLVDYPADECELLQTYNFQGDPSAPSAVEPHEMIWLTPSGLLTIWMTGAGGHAAIGTEKLQLGVKYYVWFYITRSSTGATGSGWIKISSTPYLPDANYLSWSGQTLPAATYYRLNTFAFTMLHNEGYEYVVDDALITDTAIGDAATAPTTYPYVLGAMTAGANVAGTTGVSITPKYTLANGDILYAFCSTADDTGSVWASSGFTNLDESGTSTGNDMRSAVLRKLITNAAGEPGSYTFTVGSKTDSDPFQVILVIVRGGNTTTPEDATTTTNTGTNDFTPTGVNIDVATAGALVLTFHAASLSGGSSNRNAGEPAYADGLVEARQEQGGAVLDSFVEVAYKENASSGTQTIGAWTGTDDSSSEWHVFTVAVKPLAVSSRIAIMLQMQ